MKWIFKEDIVIDESCEIVLVSSEKPREWSDPPASGRGGGWDYTGTGAT